MKVLLIIGAALMALGVAFGAFGAHALKERLTPNMLANWQTGVLYHMIHAIGIIALASVLMKVSISQFSTAGWLMFAGIIFFSGSLYVMALTGITKLGAVTPIGGVLFIAAWVFVIIGALKL
ncbi:MULTISPECIES: DUF423 domain-containing protein [Exiguobacterium]|jgi:uncharacterized membrane protein YgdD (TMEM256/DUF423 family)|uniref:Membrane protein n=1 Tax=Exiguobacterium chiriqhucha RW-2 TaxID=1345023 RepID=U1LXP2_9BACL|nr:MULTISPECIES: DUF423 domain-containing protein [Exiguobacterium]ERG67434.1 membrane protein [Exiguobacterium chiriqhucha RW-2]KAB2861214.1 MAG: DUF423 domain-containing protein [Exiguobacterium chiriqhucha]RHB48902.1 DUF423 domain-containing protein [Exiguobacterium sp. AM39-5BH]